MKGRNLLQIIFIAATMLTTTMGTEKIISLLLPALPLPDAKPTPEYHSPNKPAVCQTLHVNHTGVKVPPEPGDILMCQPFPSPTQATNNVATTSTVVKTTNTTTTEVRTVTTTTTTTIEATTTSTNATSPMEMKPCVVSKAGNGTQYNWWQILIDSGGKPGTLKSNRSPNYPVDSPSVAPCERPLQSQNPKKYTYKYRERRIREEEDGLDSASFGKGYIREEIGYTRFYGAPDEFLDVRGDFLWRPPVQIGDAVDTYSVYYVLDDTGFWVDAKPLICFDDKQCNISLLAAKVNPLRGAPLQSSDL